MIKVWQQIKMYKKLLVSFWLMNVFCFVCCTVVAYHYFSTPHENIRNLNQQLTQINELGYSVAKTDIHNISDKDLFYINNSLLQNSLGDNFNLPLDRKGLLKTKVEILSSLEQKAKKHSKEINQLSEDYGDKQFQLFMIGILCFIFGILLPLLVLQALIRTGMFAKRKSEEHLKAWVIQWHKENRSFDDPFKSPEFWSRIAIISIEHFAPLIDHPAAHYAADISAEIKAEMKDQAKPAEPSKASAA